jgi:citronellol/citronellal dehydrogenase
MLDVADAKKSPFRADLLTQQVAIVTGGGTGIGRAIARELLQAGAHVVLASRSLEHLEPAGAELSALGRGRVLTHTCDIREPESVAELVRAVLAAFSKVDILINNAGGQFPSPAAGISPKGWDAVVRNNLNGTFNMTREVAVEAMIPQRRGAIVNVIANFCRGFPGMAHTGAARAGVDNLTKTLAVEWSPYDVRVNAVAPGIIDSQGILKYPPELVERSRKRTPQKRLGTVEEVAHAVVYLASPASLFVTGATLNIDGGAALWGDSWELPEREG